MLGRVHADVRVDADDEGAQVQRRALRVRNPVPVDGDELFNRLFQKFFVDLRDAEAVAGRVQARHVPVGAEQQNPAVDRAVRLHPLEDRLAVVQTHGGGRNLEIPERHNPRVVPSLPLVIIHHKHVVRKNAAETQFALVLRFLFGMPGPLHADFLHIKALFHE